MSLKFLKKDENGTRYLLEWDSGYVQVENEWIQFIHPKEWNWIRFTPFSLYFEYDRMCDNRFEARLNILGFGIYFQQLISENKQGKKIHKEAMEFETITEAHEQEISKLKAQIKALRNETRRLKQ